MLDLFVSIDISFTSWQFTPMPRRGKAVFIPLEEWDHMIAKKKELDIDEMLPIIRYMSNEVSDDKDIFPRLFDDAFQPSIPLESDFVWSDHCWNECNNATETLIVNFERVD